MKIFLGPPGTGKTTRLLEVVSEELANGVRPEELAFVAFTRKAAHEAKSRAMEKFGYREEQLPYFRTLHSLAFKQLGIQPSEVMVDADYLEVGRAIGMQFGEGLSVDDDNPLPTGASSRMGNNCAYIDQISRLTQSDLRAVCTRMGLERFWDVELYRNTLTNYKLARKKIDFTDMMENFIDQGDCPEFKVVVVDEAQDLTPIQWQIISRITGRAERVYIAGDDDQAIYDWAGADVQKFLSLEGEFVVLPFSYRLPREVYRKALQVLTRIRHRYDKAFEPRDESGQVTYYASADQVDYSQGTWLLLTRNRYTMGTLCALMKKQGFPYVLHGKSSVNNEYVKALLAWETMRKGDSVSLEQARTAVAKLREGAFPKGKKALNAFKPDEPVTLEMLKVEGLSTSEDWMTALRIPDTSREYYRAILRHKESFAKWPRITISTIHQAKGGEADHVLIVPDMSTACYRNMITNIDTESRVFYVAVTRARQSLHIVQPRTNKFYELRGSYANDLPVRSDSQVH